MQQSWEESEERKKKEEQRTERVRRKKIKVREKVEKSRNTRYTMLFQCFVALEVRKVGYLKCRVRRHLIRCESKKCTSPWREADLQFERYKAHHSLSTSGSSDVEKVHGVVAQSTFRSQNSPTPHVGRSELRAQVAT